MYRGGILLVAGVEKMLGKVSSRTEPQVQGVQKSQSWSLGCSRSCVGPVFEKAGTQAGHCGRVSNLNSVLWTDGENLKNSIQEINLVRFCSEKSFLGRNGLIGWGRAEEVRHRVLNQLTTEGLD